MNISTKTIILLTGCFLSSFLHQANAGDAEKKLTIVDKSDLGNWDSPISLSPKNIKSIDQIDTSINELIKKNYAGYKLIGRIFTMDEDRFILILSLKNEEENTKSVYLDMTDIYKKLEKSYKYKDKIKDMESEHKPN